MFTLRQLNYALALREFGGFRAAAAACSISQPAFSRSIQNLEKEFGVPLFDRSAGKVVPTVYGERLLIRAETIYAESMELARDMDLLKGRDSGFFAVAMGINTAEISGARAIQQLVREYPRLSCKIRVTGWRDVTNEVLNRTVDIGLADVSTAIEDDRLQVEALANHRVRFFCRKGHPLHRRKKLASDDLKHYPIAFSRMPGRVIEVMPGKLNKVSAEGELVPFYETDSSTITSTVVRATDAIGVAHPAQFDFWPDAQHFHILPIDEPWMVLNYGFIFLRNRTLSPAAETFMELVRKAEAELSAP